jgi:hypothetical protein
VSKKRIQDLVGFMHSPVEHGTTYTCPFRCYECKQLCFKDSDNWSVKQALYWGFVLCCNCELHVAHKNYEVYSTTEMASQFVGVSTRALKFSELKRVRSGNASLFSYAAVRKWKDARAKAKEDKARNKTKQKKKKAAARKF